MGFRDRRGARRRIPIRPLAAVLLVALVVLPYGCQTWRALPEGLSYAGEPRAVGDVAFIADMTWVDAAGERHTEQRIFDEMFAIIASARRVIVLDMFLYNPFIGDAPKPTRQLSSELTTRLIAQKRRHPRIEIVVITDPVNTVYGGMASAQFERLEDAGIDVVMTDLEPLRDSNPVYSMFWRVFVRPFGSAPGDLLPNPFGDGRVSLRSYLRLLNFKANHRKTLLADDGDKMVALVTSANPHDGSSTHTNVAVRFDGPAVLDLLATENAVLAMSGHDGVNIDGAVGASAASAASGAGGASPVSVQVLTESRIEEAVLGAIGSAGRGDRVRLAMFYLSDRDVIDALESAHRRGADVRVLLDPNKDAFGRQKNGIPNRPVAQELVEAGVPVRWCDTHGEQCHMKMLLVEYGDGRGTLITGSANYTRRNLEDLNLETNVAVRGPADAEVLRDARAFFELMWRNEAGRIFSADHSSFADDSLGKHMLYRFMEASGIGTF